MKKPYSIINIFSVICFVIACLFSLYNKDFTLAIIGILGVSLGFTDIINEKQSQLLDALIKRIDILQERINNLENK